MNLVENIRRVGIFIITSQTLIHFTAGKQYEKYMKAIVGVIVLLQLVGPFVASSNHIMETWQTEIEQMERQIEEQSSMWQDLPYTASPAEEEALQQIEEGIKDRLNEAISDKDIAVTDVVIDFERADGNPGQGDGPGERSWNFRCVKVTLRDMGSDDAPDTHEHGSGSIRIERIIVGSESGEAKADENTLRGTELDHSVEKEEYRRLFAQMLGVAEDRVEVTYLGGW